MNYRRYGYKAPAGNEGGAHDKYAIFRFAVVVLSFVMLMLSWVFGNNLLFGHYFFSGLLFLLVGFAIEFVPKVRNIPIILTAIILIFVAIFYRESWFSFHLKIIDEHGRYQRTHQFVIETFCIYIVYNLILIGISFIDSKNRG